MNRLFELLAECTIDHAMSLDYSLALEHVRDNDHLEVRLTSLWNIMFMRLIDDFQMCKRGEVCGELHLHGSLYGPANVSLIDTR